MKRVLHTVMLAAAGGAISIATCAAAASKSPSTDATVQMSRSAPAQPSAVAPSLPIYSNLGTDASAYLLNGGISTSGTTRYSAMVCNPLTLAQGGPQLITAYSVVLRNQNAAAFTPTQFRTAFYDNNGANGGPGRRLTNQDDTYYGGGNFTGASMPASGTYQLNAAPTGYTAAYVPAATASTHATVWACVSFSAPSGSVASLANLGVEKYANAPTAGSTSDLAFVSTVGVATPADNPAGTLVAGSGTANVFGWELTTLGANTLLDSLQVTDASGTVGTAAYAVNPATGVDKNFSGYAALVSAPPLASASWNVTGLVLHPSCSAVASYTDVQATIKFWDTFNGSTAADVFSNSAPIAAQTVDLGAFNCTSTTAVLTFPVRLPTAVSLGHASTFGITVEYLADSGSGLVANGAFAEVLQNAPAASPFIAVGDNASTGNTGWYKSASNRADLNFTGASDYVTATRQHLVLRVYADMVAPTHTVTASTSGPGTGSISPPGASTVFEGATVAYSLVPAAGNHVVTVTGTCGGTLSGNTFTTSAITGDCTVNAFFAPGSGTNGVYVSPPLSHAIQNNSSGTSMNYVSGAFDDAGPISGAWDMNFWASSGSLTGWPVSTYGGKLALTGTSASVLNAGDIVGPALTYSGTGTTVSMSAPWLAGADAYVGVQFACNGRLTFAVPGVCYGYIHLTTTAAAGFPATVVGYAYDGDGNPITIGTVYRTITSSVASGGGIIDPTGAKSVVSGSTMTYTLYPDAGFHVASVGGDCGGMLTGNSYTTNTVTANCTVIANFAPDVVTYTITAGSSGNGSITPSGMVTVNSGDTKTFALTPALGYHVDTIGGTCPAGAPPAGGSYTTGPITADCSVTANFAVDPVGGLSLTVGLTPGGNGSTCGVATSAAVNVGDTVDFCYTVTNNSPTAMAYSTLDDSVSGNIFTNTPTTIAANGGTYVYHRSVTASANATFDETWTSRDLPPGYTYNDTGTSAFVDISGTGTALGYATDTSDDEIKGVTMPFAFSFYGASSDKLCVSNNGLIFFGVGEPCPTGGSTIPWFGNAALPASTLPNAAILPFWDDFGNGPGDVYYATQGVAPARKFIVQWNNIQHYSSTPQRATFEVVLDEATGAVSFEYLATLFGNTSYNNGISATVGLQASPTVANQYSFNTASLSAGKSIVWTSGAATVLTANASVSLDVGAPAIAVTPTDITASAPAGSSTPVTQNLSIANTGNRDLTWSITEAPANRASLPATPVAKSPSRAERNRIVVLTDVDRKDLYEQREIAAREGHPVQADLSNAGMAVSRNVLPAGSSCGPSVQGIVIHDDDSVENGYSGNSSTISSFVAVDKFTPSGYPATFTSVCTAFVTNAGATSISYEVVVFDDTGAGGGPGAELGAVSATSTAIATDVGAPLFTSVDISSLNLNIASGSVYIGVRFSPMAMPGRYVSSDEDGPTDAGGYLSFDNGSGPAFTPAADSFPDYRSLMVRAVEGVSGCVLPSDVSWLSVGTTSGTVQVGDPADTTIVTMNPTGLVDGLYTANVCVASNDVAHPMTSVPVSFTVGNVDAAATVNPTSLAFTVEIGDADSDSFSIANSGDPGSVLTYAITEAVGSCGTAVDSPWLSASPTSGSVPIGTPASVSVAVDSSSLAVGSYSAILCLATNDPAQPTIPVAVSLTVTLPDLIFADGFDPASALITGTINQPAVADGDGSSFDFVTGSFHGYDAGITADDINLYTLGAPSINVYWYGDAVPTEFADLVGGVVATDGGADFRVLQSGDTIGSTSLVSAASNGADMSAFEVGVDGYIGIAFYNENTAAVNYGYLHVQTSAGGFPIQVLDYGYDPTGADVTIP